MRRIARLLSGEAMLAVAFVLFAAAVTASVLLLAGALDDRGRIGRLEQPTPRERRQDIKADLRACLPNPKCRADVLAFARSLERAARRDRARSRTRSRRRAPTRNAPPRDRRRPKRNRAPNTAPRRSDQLASRRTPRQSPRPPSREPAAPSAPQSAPATPQTLPPSQPPAAQPDTQIGLDVPCIETAVAALGC